MSQLYAALAIAGLVLSPATASGAVAESNLAEAALAAKTEFQPLHPARPAIAKTELINSLHNLQNFLNRGGKEYADAWKSFLRWNALGQQLRTGNPDVETLSRILKQFFMSTEGLEHDAFLNARDRLRVYIDVVMLAGDPDLRATYSSRLDALALHLASLDLDASRSDAAKAGRIVAWLESADQAPELVQAVRARYNRSNGFGQVSARLVQEVFQQDFEDRSVIEETVMGAYTRGTAHTRAKLTAALVPNSTKGTIELRMRGRAVANDNVAYSGPATIYSSAVTQLFAQKPVLIDCFGLHPQSATARCKTSMQIQDIDASRRIIERIAWRRAGRMQGEAETTASRLAEERVAEGLDEEAQTQIDEANEVVVNQLRNPLIRRAAFPPVLDVSTTSSHLRLKALMCSRYQLAEAGDPPPIDPAHDIAVVMHESFVENFSEIMLGGKTLEDDQLLELMKIITGSEPRALWVHARTEPWSINLVSFRPIAVRFRDELLEISIRGREFRHGDRVLGRPLKINGMFRMEITPDGPHLIRQGDIAVSYLDEGTETSEQARMMKFVRQKFRAILAESLYFDGLTPPAGGSLAMLRKLHPKQLTAADGWAVLGYQMEEEPPPLNVVKN